MANGRCHMHGGASTGPRTAEGLARSRRVRWKHGLYSAEALAEQKRVRALLFWRTFTAFAIAMVFCALAGVSIRRVSAFPRRASHAADQQNASPGATSGEGFGLG
jgi:hypothetical protein